MDLSGLGQDCDSLQETSPPNRRLIFGSDGLRAVFRVECLVSATLTQGFGKRALDRRRRLSSQTSMISLNRANSATVKSVPVSRPPSGDRPTLRFSRVDLPCVLHAARLRSNAAGRKSAFLREPRRSGSSIAPPRRCHLTLRMNHSHWPVSCPHPQSKSYFTKPKSSRCDGRV
jgi:hypothetical protein